MEECCITDLAGGEVPPPVLSEKGMQTERLNTVEKEIQTEQSKRSYTKNVSKPYHRSAGM